MGKFRGVRVGGESPKVNKEDIRNFRPSNLLVWLVHARECEREALKNGT